MESPIEQTPTVSPLTPTPPSTSTSPTSQPHNPSPSPGDARRDAVFFASVYAHCQNVEAGQPHKFRSTLEKAYGARAGRIPGSRPSEAMRKAGQGERVVAWGFDTLIFHLADCQGYVAGSKKPLKGVESEKDRIDIVA